MRHSCTGRANGENGLNPGFMHHTVWRVGRVKRKQKAASLPATGGRVQEKHVTVESLRTQT